jgi:hypothetical protein
MLDESAEEAEIRGRLDKIEAKLDRCRAIQHLPIMLSRMPAFPQRDLPDTIDGVIECLHEITETALAQHSRLGYFAALYNRVTVAIRDHIAVGSFEDDERIEQLDVAFANRYLDAFYRYHRDQEPTGAWKIAFESAEDSTLSVLQHLFLGMNAHIHLDLGIASTDTAGEEPIESIEHDFHLVNCVLASLVPQVEEELREINHRFTTLQHVAHGLDQKVFNFSMVHAREDAWRFAVRLADVDQPTLRDELISERDTETVTLAHVFASVGAATLTGGGDQANVADHIRLLARGEYGATA